MPFLFFLANSQNPTIQTEKTVCLARMVLKMRTSMHSLTALGFIYIR